MSDDRNVSQLAARSLRLGLMSFILTALTGVPALLLGIRGLLEIRRGHGQVTGRSLAWAGIGSGLVGTTLGILLLMIAVEKVEDSADRTT